MTLENKELEKICLWCGKNTNDNYSREHIFPECIGGKKMLPKEYMHKECNQYFSHQIDKAMLRQHPAILDAYQVDNGIKRKGKSSENKARYEKERKDIKGAGEAKLTSIKRNKKNTIEFVNVSYRIVSENFIRSLHKCVANILCDIYGPSYVRKNYSELLDFVWNGGDVQPWSYAVSYPNFIERILISEPKVINRCQIRVNNKESEIISWIHTSGIWIVGASPFLLNPELIETISNSIVKTNNQQKLKKPLTHYFGNNTFIDNKSPIGELKFLWVLKDKEGTPNPNFLYLLTKCNVCGRTSPTGFTLPREIIYKGDTNRTVAYPLNFWNNYLEEELMKLGYHINKINKEKIEKLKTKKELRIPMENDVKKMQIKDCYCQCINCGNMTKFSAKDCFI